MSHNRFSRTIIFLALATALILPASAAARTRIGIGFGGGYYGGPFYPYGYGPYGYPYGYGYGYAPFGPYGYSAGRPLGEVHIKSPDSNAHIFINGAFAGRAHDLKTIYLAPGTYNIEQRIGPDVQKERVYVLANRSLKIQFDKPGTTPVAGPYAAPRHEPDAYPQPAPGPDVDAPQPAPAPAPEARRQ